MPTPFLLSFSTVATRHSSHMIHTLQWELLLAGRGKSTLAKGGQLLANPVGRAGGELEKTVCHIPTWFLACLYRVCFIVSESKVELNTSLTSNASSAALRRSSPFPKFGICSKSNKPASSSSTHLYQGPGKGGAGVSSSRQGSDLHAHTTGVSQATCVNRQTDGHNDDTKCKERRRSGEHGCAQTSASAGGAADPAWPQLTLVSVWCPIAARSSRWLTEEHRCILAMTTAMHWSHVRSYFASWNICYKCQLGNWGKLRQKES